MAGDIARTTTAVGDPIASTIPVLTSAESPTVRDVLARGVSAGGSNLGAIVSAASAGDGAGERPADTDDSPIDRGRASAVSASRRGQRVVPRTGDAVGERNRFIITGTLGSGGMGVVCKAHDQELDRSVAIKFIHWSHDLPWQQLTALLRQEAKVTAKLNHENIVSLFDIGTWGRVPFLVMEYLDGETLSRLIRREPPGVERATEIMIDVLAGLDHAHRTNVIHRDLKPSNVFIVQGGRAKILDFGLAHIEQAVHLSSDALRRADDPAPKLVSGGTPPYMAPEQWRRSGQDARTDVWAAGVVLYEMLTGELPQGTADVASLRAWSASRQPVPSILSRRSALPEALDRIVARALRKDRRQRYQTAAEFLAALRETLTSLRGGAPVRGDRKRTPERRQATLLSAAPVVTAFAGDEPDDAVDELGLFQEVVTEVVNHHGGRIFAASDSVLAGFGYPVADDHDALRAVRAGMRIVDRLRECGQGARIGIHTGVVVVEELGGSQGAAVRGDAPRAVVALANQADPGVVLLSDTTRRLVEHLVSTELRPGDHGDAAGRPSVYRVLDDDASGSRFESRFAAKPTPFVGRGRRIRLLFELWEAAKQGRGKIVHISGEAGIGKSRLVQELRQRAEKDGYTRLTCQAWPHFRDSAFRPIVELLLRSLYIRRDDPPAVKLTKLEHALAGFDFSLADDVPVFAPLLGVPLAAPYQALDLPPVAQKSRTLSALVRLLVAMARHRPVLFVVEDLHWVDHSTGEMIHQLMAEVAAARLLLVLTSRPEFRPAWSDRSDVHSVSIERLSASQTAAMIQAVATPHSLPPELITQLVLRSDGIPLFVEEMTTMITDAITADGTLPQVAAIPATLSEILLARLDRLPSISMEIARVGAVIGRSFSYNMIRRVCDIAEDTLAQGLAQLVDAGLLMSSGRLPVSKYRFKHALIQDSAYQSLLKKQRQERHSRVAEVLETDFPETEPELLAHHHTEAGHAATAFELWTKAGQRAVGRSANVEALGHFQNALAVLRTFPDGADRNRRELNVLLLLGSPLMALRGYGNPEVEKNYARAYDLCVSADASHPDTFSALQGLWQYCMVAGNMPKAMVLSEQLLGLAHTTDNDLFKLLAHRCFGATALVIGDLPAAREHLTDAFRFYNFEAHKGLSLRYGHDPGVAYGLYHAWTLWLLGYPDQALARVRRALDLATRLAHPMTIAFASCYTALIYCHRGEFDIARDMADHAIRLSVEHKLALWLAFANMMAGWARCGQGELDAGVQQFKDGLAGWKGSGAGAGMTFFALAAAECCRSAGWLDQATELVAESAAIVIKNDEHYYEAELFRVQGELAVAAGDLEAAERLFRAAMALAARQQARPLELRAAMSLARLVPADEGRRIVAAVYRWFTEGLDTRDLVLARQLLG